LPADRVRLREILSQGNWELHEASDCGGALALLRDQSVAVLLCERDHADGNWEDILKATARLPAPPNLIVFSRLADESLWAQVLNLGGFDVLMTPFEAEEVLRVTFAAWSHWECDFGARTAKEATRTGRPAAVKAAPPEEDWLPGERRNERDHRRPEPDGLHEPGVRTWLQQGSS
jgi:DNA-binding response OmpR family regulator